MKIKIKIFSFLYKNIFKKIAFQMDPEKVHDRISKMGVLLGSNVVTRKITKFLFFYKNKKLEQNILGINFPNPIGLSAGFDKDAELIDILPAVGFGFIEIGSITGEPCKGNEKPRLWRLPKSKGLVVYYGLKNKGCEEIYKRLKNKKFPIPVGVSIAKTNCQATADTFQGIKDYTKAYKVMNEIGAYVTINISCPNAFGGQPFTDSESLDLLLNEIFKIEKNKPVFIKLSPDLSESEIDALLLVVEKYPVDGFICTNLTKKRGLEEIKDEDVPEKGGISGKVVENLSNDLIAKVYKKTGGKKIIIGVGGVFSGVDAYKKIKAGASLIQMITGMIFEGPQVIGKINQELVELLEKDGYNNISEAVGVSLK